MTRGSISIRLVDDLSEVSRMNDWLDSTVSIRIQDGRFHKLKLFLNEAVENTIRYGFGGREAAEVDITISWDENIVFLTVSDNGQPFDPTQRQDKPQATDIASVSIGGFGVQLMRDAATDMRYQFAKGRNILSASFDA